MTKKSKAKKQPNKNAVTARKNTVSHNSLISEMARIIDPQGDLTGLVPLLGRSSPTTVSHLHKLVSETDQLALQIVSRVASEEMLTSEGRDSSEVVGALHFAATVAPVISAFPSNPFVCNPDGSLSAEVTGTVERLRNNIERHWNCLPSGLALEEKNRFYYARGFTLLSLMPEETYAKARRISREFDRHMTWVGSCWNSLLPVLSRVVEDGTLDREFLSELMEEGYSSSSGCGEDDCDPGADWKAMAESYAAGERDWEYDGYSILPYSRLDEAKKKFPAMMIVGGVATTTEDLIYLNQFSGEDDLGGSKLMSLCARLTIGRGFPNRGYGELPILFLGVEYEWLQKLVELYEGYGPEDKDAVFRYLDLRAFGGGESPMQSMQEFKHEIMRTVVSIPVLRPFHDAEFEAEAFTDDEFDPDDYLDIDYFEGDEIAYQKEVEIARLEHAAKSVGYKRNHDNDQNEFKDIEFAELLTGFNSWIVFIGIRVSGEGAASEEVRDLGCTVDGMHTLALSFMIGGTEEKPDLSPEYISIVSSKLDAVCRNAKSLFESGDISAEALSALE